MNKSASVGQGGDTSGDQRVDAKDDGIQSSDGAGDAGTASRRRLLSGAVFGVGAGVIAGSGTAAAMTRDRSSTLTVDVACLGPTFRSTLVPVLAQTMPALYGGVSLDPTDLAGSPFAAEGIVYPGGTITGDEFIPTDDDALGMWICRGFFVNGPRRPEPHLSTDQTFHFGAPTYDSGIGNSMIATHGLEGGNEPGWHVNRIVTGGTGSYRGARGECRQTEVGRNSTLFPWGEPALNFRFEFDLMD